MFYGRAPVRPLTIFRVTRYQCCSGRISVKLMNGHYWTGCEGQRSRSWPDQWRGVHYGGASSRLTNCFQVFYHSVTLRRIPARLVFWFLSRACTDRRKTWTLGHFSSDTQSDSEVWTSTRCYVLFAGRSRCRQRMDLRCHRLYSLLYSSRAMLCYVDVVWSREVNSRGAKKRR